MPLLLRSLNNAAFDRLRDWKSWIGYGIARANDRTCDSNLSGLA